MYSKKYLRVLIIFVTKEEVIIFRSKTKKDTSWQLLIINNFLDKNNSCIVQSTIISL